MRPQESCRAHPSDVHAHVWVLADWSDAYRSCRCDRVEVRIETGEWRESLASATWHIHRDMENDAARAEREHR